MKHVRWLAPLCLGLALASMPAQAKTTAISCDGCSPGTMSVQAANAADAGDHVYVFNLVGANLMKFKIQIEDLGGGPYSWVTYAVPVSVPSQLERSFDDFVDAYKELTDEGLITMPEDFPIRSVAGAFLDPAYTSTLIELELRNLSEVQRFTIGLGTIVSHLIKDSVPLTRLNGLFSTVKITIRFPDGSTQDYEISASVDAITGDPQLEVRAIGNAFMHDGQPAPTSAYALDGKTFEDRGGSYNEWLQWAKRLHAEIVGSGGTTMTCKVQGSEIVCIVRRR